VTRPRPPDRSTFTTSSRIEVDRHRQPTETWCVMVSTIGQMIAVEHRGLQTVINMTQEQPERLEVINFQVCHGIREFTWLAGCFAT
jgi:hypothetical protein